MKIAVLFDGAGLARLGLEQANHTCVGYELDPLKHHLSQFVGSGNSNLRDVMTITDEEFAQYDAIWASPPCQLFSSARTNGAPSSEYSGDFLSWSINMVNRFPDKTIWIENVIPMGKIPTWGKPYNAAQFLEIPIQNRNRLIGGYYNIPHIYREYKKWYPGLNLCPTVTATEYRGCKTDKRRASRFYGRKLTVEECAYHQGFQIPDKWYTPLPSISASKWKQNIYEAIGNGVPVYMARAFGSAYVDVV